MGGRGRIKSRLRMDMDKLAWLARHPNFAADPLSLVRRVMRRARDHVGANEGEFADLLHSALPGRTITAAIVQSWEQKPPPPPGDVLAVALGLLGRNLAIELEEHPTSVVATAYGFPSLDRRDPAFELVWSGLDTARLQAAAAGNRPDQRLVDDLAVITEEYWCLYHRMAPRSLQPIVAAHHDLMRRLLANTPTQSLRQLLAGALGEAAMLDGWLSFLLDDRRTARSRWALADDLAHEFANDPLHAHVLIARSSLASTLPQGGRTGESTVAITLLDEAEHHVGGSAALRAWLLARRAEEHAA
jgi:hypothetical protein